MKSKIRTWLFLLFALIPCLLFSQNNSEISIGAGFPDFLNMKFKLGKEVQIYGGAGFFPGISAWSVTAGLDLHFPLKSIDNKTRKFYLNNGGTIMSVPKMNVSDADRFFVMYSRIGFSFYDSAKNDRTGFDFDMGVMYDIGPKYETINRPPFMGRPTTIQVKRDRLVFPAASISYFFKL
jgi:hypothetical protein